jgi:D-glycero-alpha-D-manno-heptose-7-phosphate kinase
VIIIRTPLRISFLGGGTDYPEYFSKYGNGAVLGTAIDKYVYLSVSKFYSELFDYSIRISYRQVECVKSLEEIQHIPFRECLRWCGITNDVEVDFTAELPAYTGLGSSASFIVGLLKSLYAFKGQNIDEFSLAQEAIKVERDILKEPVGCQDQLFASFGGFNLIKFYSMDNIAVQRVPMPSAKIREFEDHLMLFFTGIKRRATDIIKNQIEKVEQNKDSLKAMRLLVDEGYNILTNSIHLEEFGRLLHKSWVLKRSLDGNVANDDIDKMYAEGLKAGALGGKLLGAGGGGFILLFVPPKNKQDVRNQLHYLTEIPIRINAPGSHILNGTHMN